MSKDITNERLFEFMTKMYGEMQEMKVEMQEGFREVKYEVKKTNTKIDHEVMPKIDALFDGHKQNSDKLDRIEEEVSKHEEIILRRIK
ncbi:hypothetical protein [Schnuerera sp.]|uniref:hypothetical protein n=1 Tax=Schnuerera sp. TaxID=2794844 RepID=UPI002C02CCD1|nr:hypothetical protein [Schnuerera sp.]HSH34713.1 hypothetical protein [Schnuerera sp.]